MFIDEIIISKGGINVQYDADFIEMATHIMNDAYGQNAFAFKESREENYDIEISIAHEKMEGEDIMENGVIKPLKQLIEAAAYCDVSLNGQIEMEGLDFEPTTICIVNNEIRYEKTLLLKASDAELKRELRRRGYLIMSETQMIAYFGLRGSELVKAVKDLEKKKAKKDVFAAA